MATVVHLMVFPRQIVEWADYLTPPGAVNSHHSWELVETGTQPH